MVSLEEAQSLAKRTLSAKRYSHTCNVAKAARSLARRYGVNEEHAALAAWLHDIAKEKPRDELLQLLSRDAIIAKSTRARPLPVWHGPCAAILAKQEMGVDNEDVLSALCCHTTGKVGMSTFDKVIFLADVISEEHTHPGVGRIRQLARQDLDAAVQAAMEQNVAHLEERGKPLDRETVEALEDLRRRRAEKEMQI